MRRRSRDPVGWPLRGSGAGVCPARVKESLAARQGWCPPVRRKKPRRPSGTGARTGRGAGTIPAYSVGRCAAVKGSLRRPGRFRAVREPSPLHTTRRPGISNSDPGVLAALDSRSAPQQRTVPSLTETTALSQPRPHQQPPPSFIAESSTISIFQAHFRIGMDFPVFCLGCTSDL